MAFPAIASVATSSQTTNSTTHTVTMPSGVATGDKLVAAIITDGRPIDSGDFANNWTQRIKQADGGDHVCIFIYEKTSDGSEGATETFTTDVGQTSAHRVWRLTGVAGGTAVEVTGFEAPGAGTSCDPPANDPAGWGAEDTLWITVLGIDSGTTGVSTYPTNYTNTGIVNSGDDADGCSVAWATRENNTASEDPGAFTIDTSEFFTAATIAVRPAGLVEFIATGTKSAGGTTTVSVAYPTGVAAGRLTLVGRCGWESDMVMVDESGWTNTAELAGGTGTAIDAHTTKIRVDRKELAGSESGSVTFDQTGGTTPGCLGIMLNYAKLSGTTWDVAFTTGDDATHDANRSVTASGTVSLQTGDVIVAFVATDTDANLASFSAPAITAAGITFGTTTRRSPASAGVGTGDDGNIEVFDAIVTAGTGTVAPALAFTTTTNQCGPVAFVRLRAATSTEVNATLTADLGGSSTITASVEHLATPTADLGFSGTMSATAAADVAATLTSDLGGTSTISATVEHSASATADLGGVAQLTSAVEHVATLAADLGGTAQVTAITEHVVSTLAALGGVGTLTASVDVSAALVSSLGGAMTMTATTEHQATLTSNLGLNAEVTATVEGDVQASAAATFGGVAALTATVEHSAVLTSALGGAGTLAADVTGPDVTATLNTTLTLQGSLVATAEHITSFVAGLGGTSTATASVEHAAQAGTSLGFDGSLSATVSWEMEPESPMFGSLCEPWPFIWCGDISGVNPEVTGHAIMAASEVLWEATGRRFGNCAVTVRPCRQDCAEFPPDTQTYSYGVIASTNWGWPFPTLVNGSMINFACGLCVGNCSCTAASEVILPETIYAIDSIVIDGATLPVSGWALYDGQRLVRTDGEWPLCQDWTKTAGGTGVWSITARFGAPVPTLGQQAVGILGLEIAKLCCGMDCNLPPQVTRVTRQGVSMERMNAAQLLQEGLTGLYIPDQFIRTFNPGKLQDRARVYSPDVVLPRVVG